MTKRQIALSALALMLVLGGGLLISRLITPPPPAPKTPCEVSGAFGPSLSPDGTRVAYQQHTKDFKTVICIMDIDGANKRQIMIENDVVSVYINWSNDSTLMGISYIFPAGNNSYILPTDTLELRNLGLGIISAFMLDGNILWHDLRITDLTGKELRRLAQGDSALISPDGKLVAFRPTNERDTMWVIDIESAGLRKLTGSFNSAWWTSTSQELFYTEYQTGPDDYAIYSITLDAIRKLVVKGNQWTSVQDSPNSGKILFTRMTDDHTRIQMFIADPDGQNEQLISDSNGNDSAPIWTPDGQKIVFQSYRKDSGLNIYSMNPDGTDLKKLTGNS